MIITSLNPEGFAKTLRDVRESILLIKDTLTGTQELNNIAQQAELLNIAMNQGIYSDNSEIFSFYEKERDFIQQITQLRAAGETQEAATMAAKLDRYNNILQQLTATSNKYTELVNAIEQAGAAANISDTNLRDMVESADQIYLSLSALSTIKTPQDVRNFLTTLKQTLTPDALKDNTLVTHLESLFKDTDYKRLTKNARKNWGGALQTVFDEIKADAQKNIQEINKIIESGFKSGGKEDEVKALFEQFQKNPDATINQLSAAYANLITQQGGATEAQKAFLDALINMKGKGDAYDRLRDAAKQLKENLENIRQPKID